MRIQIQKTQQNKMRNFFYWLFVLEYSDQQGIDLRGHKNDAIIFDNDDSKQGNFKELLKLVAENRQQFGHTLKNMC